MTEQKNQNIVVYNDGELELKVSSSNERLWLTQLQLCDIFLKRPKCY